MFGRDNSLNLLFWPYLIISVNQMKRFKRNPWETFPTMCSNYLLCHCIVTGTMMIIKLQEKEEIISKVRMSKKPGRFFYGRVWQHQRGARFQFFFEESFPAYLIFGKSSVFTPSGRNCKEIKRKSFLQWKPRLRLKIFFFSVFFHFDSVKQ